MATVPPKPNYRPLPGRTATFVSIYRLYEGPDHLLLVRTTWFREDYRRFFYRDIQAVITRPTQRRRDYTYIWGALTGTAALPTVASFMAAVPVLPWGLLTLTAVLATGFVVNWLRGPTCECHLQTAVQCEALPGMTRQRRVDTLLTRLRARIAGTQGTAPGNRAEPEVSPAATPSPADLPPVLAPESPPPA